MRIGTNGKYPNGRYDKTDEVLMDIRTNDAGDVLIEFTEAIWLELNAKEARLLAEALYEAQGIKIIGIGVPQNFRHLIEDHKPESEVTH